MTPLEPRQFFNGLWSGKGELLFHRPLGWIRRPERINFVAQPSWLSHKVWLVREKYEFSSGKVLARTMFVEIVSADRLHVTAEDMPSGASVVLQERGFRFEPYYILSSSGGMKWRLKCYDENLVDEDGVIHDTLRMFFSGFHVATMKLAVTVDRSESQPQ